MVAPDAETMKKALRWKKVTTPPADRLHEVEEHCPRPGCVVGAPRPGEFCEIVGGAVAEALDGCDFPGAPMGKRADQWLFKKMVEAILLGAKDGAVWRSGKHVIFSNPNRNQAQPRGASRPLSAAVHLSVLSNSYDRMHI